MTLNATEIKKTRLRKASSNLLTPLSLLAYLIVCRLLNKQNIRESREEYSKNKNLRQEKIEINTYKNFPSKAFPCEMFLCLFLTECRK